MPKQLYIPLPCAAARSAMIERQLGPASGVSTTLSPADVAKIVEKTAGYSGKHISLNSKRSLLCPVCVKLKMSCKLVQRCHDGWRSDSAVGDKQIVHMLLKGSRLGCHLLRCASPARNG